MPSRTNEIPGKYKLHQQVNISMMENDLSIGTIHGAMNVSTEQGWKLKYVVELHSINITHIGEQYLKSKTCLSLSNIVTRLYLFTEEELEAIHERSKGKAHKNTEKRIK